ncbi:hypothetical protein BC940DRAFT_238079 [Gongronella butleri]|nr:hypothetical protein BC940DRAFT_238079 [Gongronella butleri]
MVPVASAQAYTWAKAGKTRRSLVRSQSSATFAPHVHEDDRLLAAAVMLVCPDIEITRASRVPFHVVLESELEAKIHRLDATESPTCYKFGALTVRPGQTREQDWIGNTGVTPAFDTFLNHLGRRISLQYYRGYSGGLDTYTNETGETSVVASWQDFEMMFHVPALMPFRENDAQHVHRKRYLGNDIVCVVFLDGADVVFDPCAIKSRFLHVYIIVRPVEQQGWRVEVVRKDSVPEFGPALPSPPIFEDPVVLHQFLMVKCKLSMEIEKKGCSNS